MYLLSARTVRLCGLVTDRDLVVKGLAEGLDASSATIEEICSHNPVTLSSDQSVEDAVKMMREHDIRRLPVVDGGDLVGIVSLGDLAIEKDPKSVLADISKAPAKQLSTATGPRRFKPGLPARGATRRNRGFFPRASSAPAPGRAAATKSVS